MESSAEGGAEDVVQIVPDLAPLGLPTAEEAVLQLLLVVGRATPAEVAGRLDMSGAQVSRAAAGLRERGFLVAGLDRSWGLVLAPLDAALDALLAARRESLQSDLDRLEETRRGLLDVARWSPERTCPHVVVARDLREWERILQLQQVRASLDVVIDVHHVNTHVPGQLMALRHRAAVTVRLLVTGVTDSRPVVVTARATDLDLAGAGIPVRRLQPRCAAFTLYDGERLEVPLWRLSASGWSTEAGETWAARRLFDLLWQEAEPWPAGPERPRPPHVPPQHWPPVGPARGVVGSAR